MNYSSGRTPHRYEGGHDLSEIYRGGKNRRADDNSNAHAASQTEELRQAAVHSRHSDHAKGQHEGKDEISHKHVSTRVTIWLELEGTSWNPRRMPGATPQSRSQA